jgi:WD40 repeat protein
LRSPQRNVLAVTVPEGIIQLWDLDKGTLLQSLEGHSRAYRAVAFSPNGQLVGTTCLNNKLQLWEVSTGILKQSLGDAFPTHSDSATVSVAFSPNAEIVAVGSNNGIIEFWNVRSSCFVSQYTLETRHAITALAFSPDGQSIAFILGDHLEESDNPSQPMKTYAPRPTPLEFNEADYRNSSHKRLATHVLNINTFLRSHVFHTLPKEPPTPATETRLRFSPDGQDIVIATDIVRRWNLRDEEILQIIDCRPIELEFNTDGTHLQTEFGDFAIKNKSKMLYPEQGIVTSDLHINAWAGYVMCYKGRPLLNVPHEFRCGNMTIHGDKLAVRDHLGGIGLWKVNPEAITW